MNGSFICFDKDFNLFPFIFHSLHNDAVWNGFQSIPMENRITDYKFFAMENVTENKLNFKTEVYLYMYMENAA